MNFAILVFLFCLGLGLYYFAADTASPRLLFVLEVTLGLKILRLACHWDWPAEWILNGVLWLGSTFFFLNILYQALLIQARDALNQLEDNT